MYATLADVQTAAGGAIKLTQLAGHDAGVAVNVDAAIAEADAMIDTYASKRFRVPFAAPPLAIRMLSARWAARILHRNRSQVLPEHIAAEEADVKWLEGLARGDVAPGVDPHPEKSSIVTDKAAPRDPTLTISREGTKGFW